MCDPRQLIALVVLATACSDAAVPDAPAPIRPDATVLDPSLLSSTGLYADIATRTLAPGVRAFAPTYALWSDGAAKQRWLWLPAGARIDTRDPAHWQLPVGAKLWKEFATPEGRRLETRLVERIAMTGRDDADYRAIAFAWTDDESDAIAVPEGRTDVRGTMHDVPKATACKTCHTGEPGFILGLSAVQLSGPGAGLRLDELNASGLLTMPVAPVQVPGDAVARTALGYLHANCGHCHNTHGAAWPDVNVDVQLVPGATSVEATATYRTTVGVPLARFRRPGMTQRIAPGDPDASGLLFRMSVRDAGTPLSAQMPPIATEQVHAEGVAALRAWIEALEGT